ncbi:MAG: hypothetical protein LBE48_02405, partial [Methanomassiliicoccaceae archaeon]|nr:hypothetical protein [Methanomassiliicoccaceae archaeon]
MEKITKQKRGVALSLMIAALLAVTAFSFISMENGSDDDGSTLGAAGDYNAGDIAAINLIIKNNGLNWTCADPADGSSVPSDWTGVTWSEDDTDRRITKLGLSNTELFGDLDVSGLTALEDLNCSTNVLESLNVSGLAALETLYCNNNLLVSLDVSKNTALRNLNCEYNVIGALDVSGLTALESLKCGANKLIALDVTKNILLEYLDCGL